MGDLSGKVQTVLGAIEPEALGITITHEHLPD
jgi:predicted metal-dependent phosphotriesterase family hydrolase